MVLTFLEIFTGFFVGVIATIVGSECVKRFPNGKRLSWKNVDNLIASLKVQMNDENFQPTLIIGIGRGGAIVGSLLSGSMGHCPLIVIDRKYSVGRMRNAELYEKIKIETGLEKVLLVSGDVVSGDTISTYFDYFKKNLNAEDVKTAGLWVYNHSRFAVDFCGIKSKGERLRMPWMSVNYRMDKRSDEEQHNVD